MPQDDQDITPRLLLEHLQRLQFLLLEKIDQNHVEVKGSIAELKGEIQHLERKIDTLTSGVDSIDARLDAVEIEKLPQRMKALEMRR